MPATAAFIKQRLTGVLSAGCHHALQHAVNDAGHKNAAMADATAEPAAHAMNGAARHSLVASEFGRSRY